MADYYVTAEVRLLIKGAKSESDAKFKAMCLVAASAVDYGSGDVEVKGQDVIACTQQTAGENDDG